MAEKDSDLKTPAARQNAEPTGVYISIKPTRASAARIKNFYSLAGFPTIDMEDLHCTLMYDAKSDFMAFKDMIRTERYTDPQIVAAVKGYDIFGDEKDCLVLRVDSPMLDALHAELKALGLKHSFSTFKAHVTLSYDAKDIKKAGLPLPAFDIEFEPWIEVRCLNKNWKSGLNAGGLRWRWYETRTLPFPKADLPVRPLW